MRFIQENLHGRKNAYPQRHHIGSVNVVFTAQMSKWGGGVSIAGDVRSN